MHRSNDYVSGFRDACDWMNQVFNDILSYRTKEQKDVKNLEFSALGGAIENLYSEASAEAMKRVKQDFAPNWTLSDSSLVLIQPKTEKAGERQ